MLRPCLALFAVILRASGAGGSYVDSDRFTCGQCRILQEIKDARRALGARLDELDDVCSVPFLIRHDARGVVTKIVELRDDLAKPLSLDECDGYSDEPVEVSPALSDKSYALRQYHRELYMQICHIVDRAQSHIIALRVTTLSRKLPFLFYDFYRSYQLYENAVDAVIFEAYYSERSIK